MIDCNGYPDDKTLQEAKDLDFDFRVGAEWMIEQFEETGYGAGKIRPDGTLELHTGGWSGCEEIIQAASESMWWLRWWHSSTRGGHYIFGDV